MIDINNKKGKKLNSKYKTAMTNLISATIYETSLYHRRKEYHFSSKEEAYQVLFCNTDSKNKLPRGCMYKSEAYNTILSEEGTCFLVGRKGSGKTTFFEVLEKYNPIEFDKRFKVLRPISVEDIREEHIYESINKFAMDYKVFGYIRMINLFWEIYLHLCAIYIVCVEEENYRIRDDRKEVFHQISNKLRKILHVNKLDSADVKSAIFTESVDAWDKFMTEGILKYATIEAFLASMDANFIIENVLKDIFGNVYFGKLIAAIERCERKILVALDKFDAISDQFRRNVKNDIKSENKDLIESALKRAEFDRILYHSLVETVEKLKESDSGIMGKVAFCIIMPQDRVDQIKMVDRDFAKKRFLSLAWDAVDLLTVILLRLKEMYNFEYNEGDNVVDKFREVMRTYLTTIPTEVQIDISGKQTEMELFQYLLRMSFWRPRDIIKYVAVLYDANEKNIDKHKQIDMVTLKNLLNDVTEDIIEDEFYNEYDKLFYNLSDFMNMFEGKNIIMPSAEFVDIIRNFKFEGVIFTNNKDNMMDKISFIYEMGVVGLKFKEEYIRAKGIGSNLCFVFNEGTSPFKKSYKEIQRSSREIEIVLNPIFSKKLSLVYNTTEVVGNYDWDYLMSNHMRKSGIKRV